MKGSLILAIRYLVYNWGKSLVLLLCMTLAIYLPLATHWALASLQERWESRGDSTPLVVGARGSRFDLALNALYFRGNPLQAIKHSDSEKIAQSGYATAIPLFIKYRAKDYPVVGTTLDYFEFRGLDIDRGAGLSILGDCVVGANVARTLKLEPGERLLTDPENVFDLSGSYPLNMLVAGVLKPTGTADDDAVFVDLKTAWIVAGIGHGHQDLAKTTDNSVVLQRDEKTVIANAALVEYTTITPENISTFHFHAATEDLPLTAIIAVPRDEKASAILQGRYLDAGSPTQVLVPREVIAEILSMIFQVRRFFDLAIGAVIVGTMLFLILVIILSLRLRKRERETMFLLGCSRWTIFQLQAFEYGIILVLSILIAGLLAFATMNISIDFINSILIGEI